MHVPCGVAGRQQHAVVHGQNGGRRRNGWGASRWHGNPCQPASQIAVASPRQVQARGTAAVTHRAAPAAEKATVMPAATADATAAAERESFQLLEWPALCRQVACFAQTPMGAELAAKCALPVGRSQEESEQLLQQTAEAQAAMLKFEGVYDVRQAVEAAAQQRVLHPMVLGAVATTLAAAASLRSRLQPGQSAPPFPALQVLGAGLDDGLPQLQQVIEQCIKPGEGRILDSASPELARVRQARRQNSQRLSAEITQWGRQAHARGISEQPQPVIRRNRMCIPVRAGRQGELPKGSVSLGASTTGHTLYVEPQPVMALNNAEIELEAREAEEESAVLFALSGMVAQHAKPLQGLLRSITALDVASARGRHAAWLGATTPPRFLTAAQAAAGGPVQLPRAWHPLLLQPCLPPLPLPLLPEELQQQVEAQPLTGSLSGLALVPELAAAATPKPSGAVGSSMPRRGAKGASAAKAGDATAPAEGSTVRPAPPQPVDLQVPAGVRVVAVTGPNTGGKTASLKALGLSCLMAKAGLFLPQAPLADGAQQAQQQGLLWFDRVLADLGDGQSLQQSLSTFSGHLRRIRNVLAAATPQSLVLLDEVGSGTDPAEGAALAAALLERLQGQAALTYATTHHAELKELAASSPAFVNASVEFDTASLRPTYRLLWGAAGESNALAVAQGLGFSPSVVAAARQVAAQLHHAGSAAGQRSQLLQQSLVGQLEDARLAAAAAATARDAAEAAAAASQRELAELQQRQERLGAAAQEAKEAGAAARRRVQQLLADLKAGQVGGQEAEEQLRAMEVAAAPPDAAALRLMGLRAAAQGDAAADDSNTAWQEGGSSSDGAAWLPAVGDSVSVLKMGGAIGRVVSAAGRVGGKVSVRVGSLVVQLRLADLAPAGGGAAASSSRQPNSASSSGSKGAARQQRAQGSLKSSSGGREGGGDGGTTATRSTPAFQTSRNTVDVRGQRAEEAAAEVQAAVLSAPSGWALFVVHGVGTGRVRSAVLSMLKRQACVAKMEEAEASNGGCTVVYIR